MEAEKNRESLPSPRTSSPLQQQHFTPKGIPPSSDLHQYSEEMERAQGLNKHQKHEITRLLQVVSTLSVENSNLLKVSSRSKRGNILLGLRNLIGY